MKNKIHIIEVESNEHISMKKILQNINEKKLTYIKNKTYKSQEILKPIDRNGPAIILNSSGSSGKPRKCIHNLHNLFLSAKTSGIWLEKQGFKLKNCLIFNTLPFNHISGLMPLFRSKVWECDYINISPQLIREVDQLLIFTNKIRQPRNHLITSLVPTQLTRLLSEKNGISWLQMFDLIWIGGASISSCTSRKCREKKINLSPCYGSTETAAMVTSLKPKFFLDGHNNVGEILLDTDLRINKKGLIEIKSERIGEELLSSSKIKDFKNENGWWESSDLGEINELNNSKFLKIIGRIDNAFNSGGEIVYPEVIKTRLNELILINNIPIDKVKISKVDNKEWGNKIEVIIDFKPEINNKKIEKSLQLLKKFSQDWPRHERPKNWIINKNKLDKIPNSNYVFKKE